MRRNNADGIYLRAVNEYFNRNVGDLWTGNERAGRFILSNLLGVAAMSSALLAWLDANPVVVYSGAGAVGAHVLLWLLFSYGLGEGPWRQQPGFTAHQAICLPLMLYLAYEGVRGWCFPAEELRAIGLTPHGRVLTYHPLGHYLAQLVTGELIAWDIPCGLFVKALREPLMLAHHVGMAIVALTVVGGMCDHYAIFFFGFIEISGVPLSIVDVFHPKHKEWHAYERASPRLQAFNDAVRKAFALAYLSVRAVYFPYVIAAYTLPDMWGLAQLPLAERGGRSAATFYAVGLLGVLFSALQMYWGYLVARQVYKVLFAPKKAEGKAA